MENSQQQLDDEGEEVYVFDDFNTEEEYQGENESDEKIQDKVGEEEDECGDEEDQDATNGMKDDWDAIFLEGEETDLDEKPHEGMKFESEHQAYTFYQRYAKHEGFGVRKGGTRRSMKDKSIIGRRFYCNREGFRAERYKQNMATKKRKRGETRTGCEARLFVNKTNDGTWVALLFIENHNHKCVTPRKSHLFSSHRKIGENRAALIDKMKAAGIRTILLMHYFSEEAQGMRNVGFTERDMRNHLRNKRQEVFQNGDAQCLLNYLNEKQVENPHFFYAIQLDSEGQMTNFFWVDEKSRIDYRHFGDVVCLDATYGTNAYAKPFVPIVGVNNHMQTVLFGCALMLDETESSFNGY